MKKLHTKFIEGQINHMGYIVNYGHLGNGEFFIEGSVIVTNLLKEVWFLLTLWLKLKVTNKS